MALEGVALPLLASEVPSASSGGRLAGLSSSVVLRSTSIMLEDVVAPVGECGAMMCIDWLEGVAPMRGQTVSKPLHGASKVAIPSVVMPLPVVATLWRSSESVPTGGSTVSYPVVTNETRLGHCLPFACLV